MSCSGCSAAIEVYWRLGDPLQDIIEQTDGSIGLVNMRDISPEFWSVLRSMQLLLRDPPGERYDDGRRDGDHGWHGGVAGLREDNARNIAIEKILSVSLTVIRKMTSTSLVTTTSALKPGVNSRQLCIFI